MENVQQPEEAATAVTMEKQEEAVQTAEAETLEAGSAAEQTASMELKQSTESEQPVVQQETLMEQSAVVEGAKSGGYISERVHTDFSGASSGIELQAAGDKTVISQNAVLNGELTTGGDVQIFGRVKGNVSATGNVELCGKIIGNISGGDIELKGCEIKGDVEAAGYVLLDQESVMVGNISAKEVLLDGKLKGDLQVEKRIQIRKNTLVVGNVNAGSISMEEGAVLQGQVTISSANAESLPQMDIG